METGMAEVAPAPRPAKRKKSLEIGGASQWHLIWSRFRRHRLAMVGSVVLLILYLLASFHAFVSPSVPNARNESYIYAPPQRVYFAGLRPYVYDIKQTLDMQTFRRTYTEDRSERHFI